MWVLSRTSEILGEHMQGRLWSKKVRGGAFAVAPKPEVGMSLWRPLCLPAVSAQQEPCSEQEQDWAFLAWWIFSCTGVFEMNVFICLRTYMKYGDLSAEIVVCWCRQFPVFWGGWVCLFLFLVKARSFTHFSAASSDASWVWDVQSCWVSPPPPFVLNDLFLFRTQ